MRLKKKNSNPSSHKSAFGVRRIVKSEPKQAVSPPKKKEKPKTVNLIGLRMLLVSKRFHILLGTSLFFILLGFGVWMGYRYLYTSPYFQLKKVEMSPTTHVEREILLKFSKIIPGKNIFRINLKKVAKNLAKHPWIKSAGVWRKLPDTLHIELKEEEAVAAVLFSPDNEVNEIRDKNAKPPIVTPFYLVNSDGKIFKRATPDELKNRYIISGIKRSEYLSDPYGTSRKLKKSIDFMEIYNSNIKRPKISEIFLTGDMVTLFLKKTGVAFHFAGSDFKKRVGIFDTFLKGVNLRLDEMSEVYMDNRETPYRIIVIPHENETTEVKLAEARHQDKKKLKKIRKNAVRHNLNNPLNPRSNKHLKISEIKSKSIRNKHSVKRRGIALIPKVSKHKNRVSSNR